MPDEYSNHSPVSTSKVVPRRFKELRMLHNLRRARNAADSNLGSPVNRDKAPISRISEPESGNGKLAYWGTSFKGFIQTAKNGLLTTP